MRQRFGFHECLPERQGQNLAVTVLCVPYSGRDCLVCAILCMAVTVVYVYIVLTMTVLHVSYCSGRARLEGLCMEV